MMSFFWLVLTAHAAHVTSLRDEDANAAEEA